LPLQTKLWWFYPPMMVKDANYPRSFICLVEKENIHGVVFLFHHTFGLFNGRADFIRS
jgi:hypothetical protein